MFPQRDQQLLAEAYSLQLLKEAFPKMTLKQVIANLDEFNSQESEWVEQFSERVILELIPNGVILESTTSKAKQLAKHIENLKFKSDPTKIPLSELVDELILTQGKSSDNR
jgi:hypothetical protein